MNLATAMGSFVPMQNDVITTQGGTAVYLNGQWRGNLSKFYPGYGYHYKSNRTEPVTVTFQTQPASQVTVTTATPTDITTTSATCGGTVTNTGDATVIVRGLCWSTQHNPTIANSHTTNGEGAGSFSSPVSDLTINTVYYIRAYAVTESGVTYGNEVSFNTLFHIVTVSSNPAYAGTVGGGGIYNHGQSCTITAAAYEGYNFVNWTSNGTIVSSEANYTFTVSSDLNLVANFAPTGAINGKFSVSGSKQVYFSQGNLQYRASTNTWRFAPNQYSYIGSANANMSSTYSGWIDLFGWGTSGYNHGANCYQPWSTSQTNSDYRAYGSSTYNLYDQTGKADWGYNAISNGGNQTNQWRTMTSEEWEYVLNTRSTASGIRYAQATVNGVNGLILLPDDWSTSYYPLYANGTNGFNNNYITSSEWNDNLQKYGAVFLPLAKWRYGTTVVDNGWGSYWSSSRNSSNSNYSYTMDFSANYLSVTTADRYSGESVRLVRDVYDHSYIDLDLPSGTLWATCNIGATNPQDYGDYFAWGETTTKSTYNWSTYQYCHGSSSTLTKYCNNSSYGYNGYTDNLTTLLPEDDAATANWGLGWYMPTSAQWQELYNNTTVTWTTQNGVYGRLFIASNGNRLFLPAAGYRIGSSLGYAGSYGYYWSSSLNTGYPDGAWYFYFDSGSCSMYGSYRYYGFTVRPVCSSRQN